MGGGIDVNNAQLNVYNSILWENSSGEIHNDGGNVSVTYTDVQGGWPGDGNIDDYPMFCDPCGLTVEPFENNVRLMDNSPCIDAGKDSRVPADVADVDDDGNVSEKLPWDLDNEHPLTQWGRLFNAKVPEGVVPDEKVDMGAYENQHICGCPWDIADDSGGVPPSGDVDSVDFNKLLADWGLCPGCGADFDCDGIVATTDFLDLLAHWGPCPTCSESSAQAPQGNAAGSASGSDGVGAGLTLEEALWAVGFWSLDDYQAWLLQATDEEIFASGLLLAGILGGG